MYICIERGVNVALYDLIALPAEKALYLFSYGSFSVLLEPQSFGVHQTQSP